MTGSEESVKTVMVSSKFIRSARGCEQESSNRSTRITEIAYPYGVRAEPVPGLEK